jgi:thiol-disulfide isomerase/thioredoxin
MSQTFARWMLIGASIIGGWSLAAGGTASKHPSLEIGSVPHSDLGKDMQGKAVRLSEHQGKVVIISFWASWCEPCKKELPVLAGLARRVGGDHMKIIAINFQDDAKRFKYVVEVLKDYPITMLRDAGGKAARRFNVRAIPRMIVIGRDGKVAADHTGYGESALPGLLEELNALLAKKV